MVRTDGIPTIAWSDRPLEVHVPAVIRDEDRRPALPPDATVKEGSS